MLQPAVPPVLYKYTSSNTAHRILQNGKLRWSSPKIFNDLAEFQRMPQFDPTLAAALQKLPKVLVDAALGEVQLDEDRLSPIITSLLFIIKTLLSKKFTTQKIIKIINLEYLNADELFHKILRQHYEDLDLSNARILCLTPRFENEVMWGTYAESHAGCVLGFHCNAGPSSPFTEAKKIIYTENPPIVGSGLDFLLYGHTPDLYSKTAKAVCFSKKSTWSYEEEWRILTWDRPNENGHYRDFKFLPNELESVTLGARSRPELIDSMKKLVALKYPEIKLYKMQAVDDKLQRIVLN